MPEGPAGVTMMPMEVNGVATCGQCGMAYHKAGARFCSRCGTRRESMRTGEPTVAAPKGKGAAMPLLTLVAAKVPSDTSKSTLRPFDVAQLREQKKTLSASSPSLDASSAGSEFRDPGEAASLSTPKRHSGPSPPVNGAAVPSRNPPPQRQRRASSIYNKDSALPSLPPASMADPEHENEVRSSISEPAAGEPPSHGPAKTHPLPPLEQRRPQQQRPTGPKIGASTVPTVDRKSAEVEKAGTAEARSATGTSSQDGASPTKRGHTSVEDEDEVAGSLRPSPEEEAQYTAWATLPPDGLTPEMLQTSNASELRKWHKGSLIGRGTYGSVYLGLLPDGSFHAVKSVELGNKKAATDHLGVLELVSLSREINMMQRLRHRNLCTFKGVYFDAESAAICMFMEYVGGGSLSALVKKFKPLPPSVVRSWTQQLLAGLHYLHSQHIIHRDIKGDNVLVDTTVDPAMKSQIKLVDFGAARRLTDAVSQSSTVIGTPYWMAPEVVDASGEGSGYSYKADVWSVGCTVAEMLTGKPPWPCRSSAPAAIMMIASATGMPTEIPEAEATKGCLDFMHQCFIRDPKKRPTVQQLLQHPWVQGEME